jgi:hypothetical protein
MIYDRFGLPLREAGQVIAEIETHTGIIAVAGPHTFEFAHLSVQEYLCADYMVREPLAEHFKDYVEKYPAPVAIAVTLSSNPSNSFAAVILTGTKIPLESLFSFLTRLLLERPIFGLSHILGAAVASLFAPEFRNTLLQKSLEAVMDLPNVVNSVGLALEYYFSVPDPTERREGFMKFNRRETASRPPQLPFPRTIYIPIQHMESLAKAGKERAERELSMVPREGDA